MGDIYIWGFIETYRAIRAYRFLFVKNFVYIHIRFVAASIHRDFHLLIYRLRLIIFNDRGKHEVAFRVITPDVSSNCYSETRVLLVKRRGSFMHP